MKFTGKLKQRYKEGVLVTGEMKSIGEALNEKNDYLIELKNGNNYYTIQFEWFRIINDNRFRENDLTIYDIKEVNFNINNIDNNKYPSTYINFKCNDEYFGFVLIGVLDSYQVDVAIRSFLAGLNLYNL